MSDSKKQNIQSLEDKIEKLDRKLNSYSKVINQLESDRDNLILAVASLGEIIRRFDCELQSGEDPDFQVPGDVGIILRTRGGEIKPLTLNVEISKDKSEVLFNFIKLPSKGSAN